MFPMQHLQEFTVLRAAAVPDPYNPEATVEDWEAATERTVRGFLTQTGSSEQADVNRVQLTDSAVLTVPDPEADILRGDMVKDRMGRKWLVQGHPARDMNPFTGWQPTTVCQLTAWQG